MLQNVATMISLALPKVVQIFLTSLVAEPVVSLVVLVISLVIFSVACLVAEAEEPTMGP